MPSVSIVLPTYNRLRWLRRAVDSVFTQSYTDWQLLIADDGSDDETREYLRSVKSSRVLVLDLPHSGNPSRVRNSALAAADGFYVAFLDSDDVWSPEKLETQLAALRDAGNCRWSYTSYDRIDGSGARLPAPTQGSKTLQSGWVFDSLLALEFSIPMPTVVAESALIKEIGGFDEEQLYGEFHDFCLRLAMRAEVVGIDRVLCSIRAHDQHYSADRMAARRAWLRLYEKFRGLAPSSAARECCERMRYRAVLQLAAHQGTKRDALGVLRTLRAGRVLSFRHPRSWYDALVAVLRPFVPASWKAARRRFLKGLQR